MAEASRAAPAHESASRHAEAEHRHNHEALAPATTLVARGAVQAAAASRGVLAVQRLAGNQAAQAQVLRLAAIQRAVLPAMAGQPPYQDGLDLATIVKDAKDLTPRPVAPPGGSWAGGAQKKNRALLKAVFGTDDQSKWDLGSKLLLQPGEIHGNQLYENKSGDLEAGWAYKEYDIAKYKGDPAGRGHDRVVIGEKDGKKAYYYTSDHYKNFAPFTPA